MIKQIIMDTQPSIEDLGAEKFLDQKFALPDWIDEPIPGKPESFKDALSEYNQLKNEIGIESITGAMEVLDSEDPEKILEFAKTLKDRPDIQEALRRMASYL